MNTRTHPLRAIRFFGRVCVCVHDTVRRHATRDCRFLGALMGASDHGRTHHGRCGSNLAWKGFRLRWRRACHHGGHVHEYERLLLSIAFSLTNKTKKERYHVFQCVFGDERMVRALESMFNPSRIFSRLLCSTES